MAQKNPASTEQISADCEAIITALKAMGNPANVAGMARFGINPERTLGISIPALRKMAKAYKINHPLAQAVWASGYHEARILAALIDDPQQVTREQMDTWANEFDSWDVCDQVCMNLFDKTPFAYEKAIEWSEREETFVKRAAFALMASLAFHDKHASDEQFEPFFQIITREATDERNFVKKAVNWALRQIGKRNRSLQARAIDVAKQISTLDSKAARWIAKDALRELNNKTLSS
ncbi:MAG: DNA alkylation repair protein [Chloroflexota bacterium]